MLLKLLITAFAVLGFAALLVKIYRELRNPLKAVPGPWHTRFTDKISTLHMFLGDKFDWLHDLAQQYGSVVRIGPNAVFLADPDDTRYVFANHREFNKGAWFEGRGGDPQLITQRDISLHAARRRMFGHLLSNTELKKYQDVVKAKLDLTMRCIAEDCNKHGSVDVKKWLTFEAADVISELSFGESFHMLEQGKKDEYIKNLENLMFMETLRLDLPAVYYFMKWSRLSPLSKVDMAEFTRYPQRLLDLLRNRVRDGREEAQRSFFTPILRSEKQNGLSDDDLLKQATEFIFAGNDTTSNSSTWLIWLVLKNPKVQARLLADLAAIPPDSSAEDLEQLPYLNAVIFETLRLYGPASGPLPRECTLNGHTFQGYYLPQGTGVEIQTHTAHRSSKYFPNPDQFSPERWLDMVPEAKACFMPFGGGSRICLGIHLAYMQLRLITARFFTTFPKARLDERVKDEDMAIVSYAVNSAKGGSLFVHV